MTVFACHSLENSLFGIAKYFKLVSFLHNKLAGLRKAVIIISFLHFIVLLSHAEFTVPLLLSVSSLDRVPAKVDSVKYQCYFYNGMNSNSLLHSSRNGTLETIFHYRQFIASDL